MTCHISAKQMVVCIVALCMGVGMGIRLSRGVLPTAAAASPPAQSPVPEVSAALLNYYVCSPVEVGVFTNRVHVRCAAPAPGNILYFAVATADSKHAARLLSLLLTSQVAGKNVGINYNPSDLSGSAIGCANSDCRLISWAAMQN